METVEASEEPVGRQQGQAGGEKKHPALLFPVKKRAGLNLNAQQKSREIDSHKKEHGQKKPRGEGTG